MAAGGSGAVRTAVIDTRGELGCFLPKDLCADVLSGYPRGTGIEIAVRTLSPQLIVCDEIGADPVEAEAIASAHNCGVALLATAHARTADELLSKKGISLLHTAHVFSYYVGLKRAGDDYEYTIARADEV
jgi:stage III sporulation protein AA